jgi:hypothetical protein
MNMPRETNYLEDLALAIARNTGHGAIIAILHEEGAEIVCATSTELDLPTLLRRLAAHAEKGHCAMLDPKMKYASDAKGEAMTFMLPPGAGVGFTIRKP